MWQKGLLVITNLPYNATKMVRFLETYKNR